MITINSMEELEEFIRVILKEMVLRQNQIHLFFWVDKELLEAAGEYYTEMRSSAYPQKLIFKYPEKFRDYDYKDLLVKAIVNLILTDYEFSHRLLDKDQIWHGGILKVN